MSSAPSYVPALVDGLYQIRDRLLVAITRLQADDLAGAAEELEAANETISELRESLAS